MSIFLWRYARNMSSCASLFPGQYDWQLINTPASSSLLVLIRRGSVGAVAKIFRFDVPAYSYIFDIIFRDGSFN